VEWVTGDLRDPGFCRSLVGDQDVLVHLAWRGAPLTAGTFAQGLRDGLLPTLNLFDAVAKHGHMRVVYPSSGGTVYEDLPDHRAHTEDDPCLPKNPYGIQKLSAEHYLRVLCASQACSASILRISTAYGWVAKSGDQQGFINLAIAAAVEGRPVRLVGDPDNVRDFVHRSDVAQALLLASLEKPQLGELKIVNIASGVGTSIREVLGLIEMELGRPITIKHEYPKESSGLPAFSVLDITRARDLLGWSPTIDLRTGIRSGIKELCKRASAATDLPP